MTDSQSITLLYTANLRGALRLLPPLFTLIQQARQTAQGPVFLLDLGDTCARDVWICQATHGRAPFLVLDSMGYDAAIIGGAEEVPIPPSALHQLVQHNELIMPVIIWARPKTLTKRGVSITVVPGIPEAPDDTPALWIDRTADMLPHIGSQHPVLGDVPQGHLARVDMTWPDWTVQHTARYTLDANTPVDSTIAAVVDMVENEAQQHAQAQGGL